MTDRPHWTWLHGPVDNPDPREGDMSASAANRQGQSPFEKTLWDMWLGQPVQPLQQEDAA